LSILNFSHFPRPETPHFRSVRLQPKHAHVQQAYGIGDDPVHVLTLLAQEAHLLAAAEEEMADLTISGGLASLQGEDDEVIPIDELIEIDFDAE